jgi:hypothetical protein
MSCLLKVFAMKRFSQACSFVFSVALSLSAVVASTASLPAQANESVKEQKTLQVAGISPASVCYKAAKGQNYGRLLRATSNGFYVGCDFDRICFRATWWGQRAAIPVVPVIALNIKDM